MSASLNWTDVALRLAITIGIGLLFGYDRSEQGKAAGMRTTVLVCLAAAVAMIQVNLLLPTAGRTSDSFVMNDLMRLPLGILTGVGFIGGGAILRRDNIVDGVTTAATLWLVTVIGLCIGGGQIVLGLAAAILGLCVLWILKRVESGLLQEHRAHFSVELDTDGPSDAEIRGELRDAGLVIVGSTIEIGVARCRRLDLILQRTRRIADIDPPDFIRELAHRPGVVSLHWQE